MVLVGVCAFVAYLVSRVASQRAEGALGSTDSRVHVGLDGRSTVVGRHFAIYVVLRWDLDGLVSLRLKGDYASCSR
jgi:hypothetical protein